MWWLLQSQLKVNMIIIKRVKFLAFSILFFVCSQAHARWATFADAPFVFLQCDTNLTVNADGSSEKIFEGQVQILNERGRDTLATLPLYYLHSTSELEILIARTINDQEVFELDRTTIEDKPLASEIMAFDQQHQVLLAFPNIKIGSVIHLKYKLKQLKPNLQGFFDTYFDFARQYMQNSSISVQSELPLYINSNDPDNYLKIKQGTEGKLHVLEITLSKPIYIDVVDERQSNFDLQHFPWVFVASKDNWQQFGAQVAKPYLKVMQQPLPVMYQDIVTAAKQQSDPVHQINTVTSMLNEQVRYMGDWKSTDGRFAPQDLTRVVAQKMGDCKDFATATATMLNQLGMQAHVALVSRYAGIPYQDAINLPGMSLYNHAIVKVQVGKKTYWVDPTNFISIADIVLPDIANRLSLVLSEKPQRERIPQSTPTQNIIISSKEISLENPKLAAFMGTFSLHGLAAIEFTGAELHTSKDTIINNILSQVGHYEYMQDESLQMPELTSRIVRNLDFSYKFKERDFVSISNAGFVVPMYDDSSLAVEFIFNPEQVSDIYLGAPSSGKKIYKLNNIAPVGNLPLDSKLTSPWLDISRKVTYNKNSVYVEYDYAVKQSWIANATIRSPEYQRMMQQLSKEFASGISIIFTQMPG